MRVVLACVASLAAAPLAAASPLADEVALLQRKAQEEPADEDKFELICDEVRGCRYHLPTSTPPPYQLICDDTTGCRYSGVTPPPSTKRPDLFKVPTQEELKNLIAQLGKALTPAAKKQLPVAAPPAPVPTGPVAHFVPDNGMCCVEGPEDYLQEKLAKLRVSPIGAGYASAAVVAGPCAGQGYDKGPNPEVCFPKAHIWMSADHPIDPTSEPKLMAAYAFQHGFASIAKGMKELCAP